MEVMDKRKKDRLVKGIALNILVFIICASYIAISVMPKYDEMGNTIARVNDTIANISALKENGLNKDSFIVLLNRLGKKKEVPDIVFSDPEKLGKVLAKPGTVKKDYLAWLVEENGKINTLDKEIKMNDAILGDIIPVFSNLSVSDVSGDIDNQITLATFISYVERDILSKYSLTSYAPLGISNIAFPDKKDTPVNIGSFKITLDFKGKNSDILSLVDALQKSGKLTIRNGKLISDVAPRADLPEERGFSHLSNLLVNIDSFSLDTIPNTPSAANRGSMTLVFYVEGMNYQKVLVLRSLLTAKFEALKKATKETGSLCAKPGNTLCNETTTASAIATIKGLNKNLLVIQPQLDAFKKGDITIDINKEMDTLSNIKTSLQSIEMTYLKNSSVLEKAKKQPTAK